MTAAAPSKLVAKWAYEIDQYDSRMRQWNKRCDDITKRYTDEREGHTATSSHRFNAFWSNVQTQLPAMYAQVPKPEIDRRFKDADPVGRACAELLQRCASFALSSQDAHPIFKQAVLDYTLCARGVLWLRYLPTFKDIAQEDEAPGGDDGLQITPDESEAEDAEQPQDIEFEEAPIDYVHRKDFGHTEGRTWEEIRAVWRRVFLTREELVERFGQEKGSVVPLNYSPDEHSKEDVERDKKAAVYEIWDKTKREAIWICKDFADELDCRPDPLKLRKFFPCPKPLYGTLSNDSLKPVPDYAMYQDQLNQLDELTARITAVTKSLKIAGCYDASAPALGRILNEGVENTLIPVDQWSAFAEKGGLKGSVVLLPLQEIAQALLDMYAAREHVKKDMYEITGLSDIMRGSTEADETATAQKLKGQFAGMRFSDRRSDVQHFLRDAIQIMVELIAEHFQPETLKAMSGLQMFDTVAEKQAALNPPPPAQPQGMPGQPPAPPAPVTPPDEAMEERLTSPTWEEVLALLHDDALRSFRIDIETDSTVRSDEEAEKSAVLEYAKVIGDMIQKVGPMVKDAPQLGPVVGEIMIFVSRRFKIGRQLEGELESAIEAMKKAAANPAPPPPPIELQKIQAQGQVDAQNIQLQGKVDSQLDASKAQTTMQTEAQKVQVAAQSDQQRAQADMAIAQNEQAAQGQQSREQNAIEAQRSAMEAHLTQQTEMLKAHLASQQAATQQQFALLIAQMNNRAKVEVAEIAAAATLDAAQTSAAQTASA